MYIYIISGGQKGVDVFYVGKGELGLLAASIRRMSVSEAYITLHTRVLLCT